MTERQCGRRHDVGRWGGFTLTGQDIENDIGGMDAVTERFGTGRFHRGHIERCRGERITRAVVKRDAA